MERRESLSNKLIKGFLSFINGTEKQNTDDLSSPDKLSLAMEQINEEEEEFDKKILKKRRMSNPQYVEFKLLMDR